MRRVAVLWLVVTGSVAFAANRAPQWKQNPVRLPAATPGAAYEARLTAFVDDPDLASGDHNFYQIVENPKWIALTFEGLLSGTPKPSDKGEHRWVIRVTDDSGVSAEATVIVEVRDSLCSAKGTWHLHMLHDEKSEADCHRLREAVTREVLNPLRNGSFSALVLKNSCNGSGQYNVRVLPEAAPGKETELASLMRPLDGAVVGGKRIEVKKVSHIEIHRSVSLLKEDGFSLVHNTGYSPPVRDCSALSLRDLMKREHATVAKGTWTDLLSLARQFFPAEKVSALEAQQTSGRKREIFYGVNVVDENGNNGFVIDPKWDFAAGW